MEKRYGVIAFNPSGIGSPTKKKKYDTKMV